MHYALLLPDDTEERFILKSPYDPVFIAAFKAVIPWDAREWDAVRKVWRVDQAFAEVVIELAQQHGALVTDKRPVVAAEHAQAPPALREACARLCITPQAPLQVAEAAFKALAKLHHPDVGGDTATMQALVEALATVKAFTEVPF
jgi:hypothetical protein